MYKFGLIVEHETAYGYCHSVQEVGDSSLSHGIIVGGVFHPARQDLPTAGEDSTTTNDSIFEINPFGKTTISNKIPQNHRKIIKLVLPPNPQSECPLRAAHLMLRY